MRIEPVFLVAPLPEPPSIPTRRAFLIAAGALMVGASVGGACGYSMGVADGRAHSAPSTPNPTPAEEVIPPSGDAELDYWRQLAVKAPLDDLFAQGQMFLHVRVRDYPRDPILWRGVARMVDEIETNPARSVEEALLLVLASHINGIARPETPSLRDRIPLLQSRRQQMKMKKGK